MSRSTNHLALPATLAASHAEITRLRAQIAASKSFARKRSRNTRARRPIVPNPPSDPAATLAEFCNYAQTFEIQLEELHILYQIKQAEYDGLATKGVVPSGLAEKIGRTVEFLDTPTSTSATAHAIATKDVYAVITELVQRYRLSVQAYAHLRWVAENTDDDLREEFAGSRDEAKVDFERLRALVLGLMGQDTVGPWPEPRFDDDLGGGPGTSR